MHPTFIIPCCFGCCFGCPVQVKMFTLCSSAVFLLLKQGVWAERGWWLARRWATSSATARLSGKSPMFPLMEINPWNPLFRPRLRILRCLPEAPRGTGIEIDAGAAAAGSQRGLWPQHFLSSLPFVFALVLNVTISHVQGNRLDFKEIYLWEWNKAFALQIMSVSRVNLWSEAKNPMYLNLILFSCA